MTFMAMSILGFVTSLLYALVSLCVFGPDSPPVEDVTINEGTHAFFSCTDHGVFTDCVHVHGVFFHCVHRAWQVPVHRACVQNCCVHRA